VRDAALSGAPSPALDLLLHPPARAISKLSATPFLPGFVSDHSSDNSAANRSNTTLIAQHRARHATDGGTARGAFLFGCHVGAAGEAEKYQTDYKTQVRIHHSTSVEVDPSIN